MKDKVATVRDVAEYRLHVKTLEAGAYQTRIKGNRLSERVDPVLSVTSVAAVAYVSQRHLSFICRNNSQSFVLYWF